MYTILLTEQYLEGFLNYCRKYRYEHDNSYLYEEEDLDFFDINSNPTVLLIINNEIRGVFSVMNTNIENGIIRVRIFHSVDKGYKLLLSHMNNHLKSCKGYRLFVPEEAKASHIFSVLGFEIQSKTYRMIYNSNTTDYDLPVDMSFEHLSEDNLESWIAIYERAFRKSITRSQLINDLNSPYVIPNGMMLLKHQEYVGIIVLSFDDNGVPEIETLAVDPKFHNQGYGHLLLKYGIHTIKTGYGKPTLSVSNQNNAFSLYRKVGFEIQKTLWYMMYKF